MSLPLEVSNHSYSLYSYFTANVNLIFSKESILNTEKIYYLIIIPLLMAFLFLINRQKPSNRENPCHIICNHNFIWNELKNSAFSFPSLILCYYLSIILNQSLSKVSMTFSRHKVKHYIQITTISVVAIIWLHLTISDKKSYQYGTPYHKYANFVFYENKNHIPPENLQAYNLYINSQNMDISERSAFVKRWLNWDHKRDNQASILSSMLNKGIFIFFIIFFTFILFINTFIEKTENNFYLN